MIKTALKNTTLFCQKFPYLILAIFTIFAALSVFVSASKLSVSTETDKLFSDSLGWKQINSKIETLFPDEKNTLVAVVSGSTPEEGREVASNLVKELTPNTTNFLSVTNPGNNPFYTSHALEFLPDASLNKLLDSLVVVQPFLGVLNQEPSATGLFKALSFLALGAEHGQEFPAGFMGPLSSLSSALQQVSSKNFAPLSWQQLLIPDLGSLGPQYEFVVTQPRRDFTSLQPSEVATSAMRAAIAKDPIVQSGRAKIFLTGDAKINDEEFSTVKAGMVTGLVLSLVLVAIWLVWAVRSIRLIIPVLITLVAGLLLTTGFAAISVGVLNLISVAFAILFVGIAVDFAIQFVVRFRGQSEAGITNKEALVRTASECGGQILVAALATSAGFLAFTPTNFVGVAQLGLIAGVGMIIAFCCTLTLLPALITVFRAKTADKETGLKPLAALDRPIQSKGTIILAAFGVIALVSVALIPRLTFDSDPLHTKNPNTEGMQALNILKANPLTTPYSAEILEPNADAAREQAEQISKLPAVNDVMWLGSMVPEDQETKLDDIKSTASILLPTLMPNKNFVPPTAEQIRSSAANTAQMLLNSKVRLPDTLHAIGVSLDKISKMDDTDLLSVNLALTKYLGVQLDALRTVLQPEAVTLENIPDSVRNKYVTPDGQYLLVIHPKGEIGSPQSLKTFVDPIKKINPSVGGTVVEIQGSAHTITNAFLTAALGALVMICIILFITLRHLKDVLLVLAPLALSALATIIWLIAIPEPLNYANVIALPLLLGVGVSFNIYFVMNWRAGQSDPLASPTARAVLFSALTTGSAFGTLALSPHTGTASMGRVLLYSLFCTLACTLIFLPALLSKIKSPK